MNKSSTFAKGALAAAAGLAALGLAATASAQPYGGPGYNGSGYGNYDPCQREASGRGVTGALVGGAGGAVIGSQIAASGHRSDGSLLGGIVGAIAGAAIGHSTAACNTAPPRYADAPPPPSYADAPPPAPPPGPSAYAEPPPPPPPPAYEGAYYDAGPSRYAERDTVWVYGRHGARFRVIEDRRGPNGCTVAESPVYMPDGRVDTRFVHVCPDYRGRYHIVD